MNKKFLNLIGVIAVITALASCVPARQYDEMKMRKATCDEENSKLRSENTNYSTQNKELTSSVADLKRGRAAAPSAEQRAEQAATDRHRGRQRLGRGLRLLALDLLAGALLAHFQCGEL